MKLPYPKNSRLAPFIGVLFMILSCISVQASTVLEMNFDDVVGTAELVFEGTVTKLEARSVQDGSIHTFVTFDVHEILKGRIVDATIELRFLGGQVGSRGLQVSDMQMPQRGERGIYFVESLQRAQVNPLVGWSQGHYLIEALGNGETVVTSADHQPVVSVDTISTPAIVSTPPSMSKGVAKGVTVRRGLTANAAQAISASQFKASIREVMERAQ